MIFFEDMSTQMLIVLVGCVFLLFSGYLIWWLSRMGKKLDLVSVKRPDREDREYFVSTIQYKETQEQSKSQLIPKEFLSQDIFELGDPVNPIQFSRINFDPNLSRSALGDLLGAALPPAIVDAISMYRARGLFRATIENTEDLLKYKDGSYMSTAKGEGGGFGKHCGFVKANPVGIFAPVMIFQALSLATSQYYLHRITEQLSALTKRLEHLVLLHHNEKISLLQAHYSRLYQLGTAKRSYYGIEDLVEIRMIRKDALAINKEYMNLLSKTDLKEIQNSATNSKWVKTNLKVLEKELVESRLLDNSNIIIFSKRLLMAANLLEMKVNAHLAQEDSRRANAITQFIDDLKVLNLESNKDKIVVQNVLNGIKPIFKEIEDSAFFKPYKKAAHTSYEQYMDKVQSTLIEASKIEQEVSAISEKVEKKLSTPVETFILIDDDGNQQQIHRIKDDV